MYLVGYVLKPQGVRGEIKVEPISPDLERYYQLDKIYLAQGEHKQVYVIEKTRVTEKFVYFKLIGIDDRNDAESLRGAEVLITGQDLIRPGEDEFFVHDLIGCTVFSDKGEELGILENVIQLSSNDVYVVKAKNGEELLIPAIKDVIEQVDIEHKTVRIRLLEGMSG